jgi:FADH2 O2-dependent halogenase
MRRINADIAIIGSSFAGSLLAQILSGMGMRVVMLDRGRHPRFAIGESSTPAADLVLADLCDRYALPELKPLAKYGSWKASHPDIRCGLKRGFSYFHHAPGEAFEQGLQHSRELLVTASASDAAGDTHWYRADVDAFLAAQAQRAGVDLIEEAEIRDIEHATGWVLRGNVGDEPFEVTTEFIVDSSGAGAVLPRRLEQQDGSSSMQTDSWCVYAHFAGVRRWGEVLRELGGTIDHHPFDCDAAALHHVLDGSWIWVLPFDGDITSVGLVLDGRRYSVGAAMLADDVWKTAINSYPSVATQFRDARLVAPFQSMRAAPRLQRHWRFCGADDWTLLPGTAGFVDPFYSTGIAHSLVGVERVARAFEQRADKRLFRSQLKEHARACAAEITLIDRLVAGAYRTFGRNPELLNHVSMLYFAAATIWEHRRIREPGALPATFLLADEGGWLERVDRCLAALDVAVESGSPDATSSFCTTVAREIVPYNEVGLCDPAAQNMYRYTALPQHSCE